MLCNMGSREFFKIISMELDNSTVILLLEYHITHNCDFRIGNT